MPTKHEIARTITVNLNIDSLENDSWYSTEGTVAKPWHDVVGESLGVPYTGSKVTHMRAMLAKVGVPWDEHRHASTDTPSKGGGNVRKEALEDLSLGVSRSPFGIALAASNAPPEPDEGATKDEMAMRAIRLRRGQAKFRAALIDAYGGRCAVSGTLAIDVLEAAHVRPFAAGGEAVVTNGLLLRADVHTLFDLSLLAIDSGNWTVLVGNALGRTEYERFRGQEIRLPKLRSNWPDADAIDLHRATAGL